MTETPFIVYVYNILSIFLPFYFILIFIAFFPALFLQSLTYKDLKGGTKDVTAHAWFAYVGPSPNDVPASADPADEVDDDESSVGAVAGGSNGTADSSAAPATPAPAVSKRKDMSGVWNRTKSVNFEAVIGATGAGFMQRKIAASMSLAHTLTLDATMNAIRVQEKGGPINIDFTITIGATEAVPYDNAGKKLTHRAYWQDDALVLHRVVVDGNYELVNKRVIDESTDVKQLVCSILYRDLRSGNEVEATSWFSYVGPSPSPLPVPDLSKLPKVAEAPAPAVNALKAAAEAAEADVDDEDDDDDVAVAKMRLSVMAPSPAARLFAPATVGGMATAGGGAASMYPVAPSSPAASAGSSSTNQALSPMKRPNFSGTWQRTAEGLAPKFQLMHTIRMDGNNFVMKEQDSNGRLLEELSLTIGADFVEKAFPNNPNKTLSCRCYWEGGRIVVQQVVTSEAIELFVKRDLEESGQQIRLVAIQRSLTTGEESESMSLFTLVGRKV
jgi:hypothetical protein